MNALLVLQGILRLVSSVWNCHAKLLTVLTVLGLIIVPCVMRASLWLITDVLGIVLSQHARNLSVSNVIRLVNVRNACMAILYSMDIVFVGFRIVWIAWVLLSVLYVLLLCQLQSELLVPVCHRRLSFSFVRWQIVSFALWRIYAHSVHWGTPSYPMEPAPKMSAIVLVIVSCVQLTDYYVLNVLIIMWVSACMEGIVWLYILIIHVRFMAARCATHQLHAKHA